MRIVHTKNFRLQYLFSCFEPNRHSSTVEAGGFLLSHQYVFAICLLVTTTWLDTFPVADLSTLGNKLKAKNYSTISDFAKDATKIFNNARYYNSKDSPIFQCAETLEKFFVQKLKEMKNNFTNL